MEGWLEALGVLFALIGILGAGALFLFAMGSLEPWPLLGGALLAALSGCWTCLVSFALTKLLRRETKP